MKKVVLIFVFLFALTTSYANSFNDLKSLDFENTLIENVVLNEFDFKSLSFDLISFTSSVDVVNNSTLINTSEADKIEVEMFDYWRRYCIYRNGRKYCTEWEYVVELEEVVIYG
jgi:hypothetical protein